MKRVHALLSLAPLPAARLALTSLLAAATEGLGIVLLVPLLGRHDASGPGLPRFLAPLEDLSLGWLLSGFVALVAVRGLVELLRALSAQDLRAKVVDGLRSNAVGVLLASRWQHLAGIDSARLRALLVTSLDRTGHAALLLADGARTVAGLGALALAGLALAPLAAIGALAAGLVLFAAHRGLRGRAHTLGEETSRGYDTIQRSLEETIAGLRLIKGHGREDESAAAARAAFADLRSAERRYVLTASLARAVTQVLAAAALALALWAGISLWNWSLALVLPLAAMAVRAVPLLSSLQQAVQDWHHAAPALDEAQRFIADCEDAAETGSVRAPPGPTAAIALLEVSLDHAPGRPALTGITIEIPALTSTAITGPSGIGKSALADILGGLLKPDSGEMLVDGVRLEASALPDWRRRVAYVHQHPVLFTGTVRDNLLWAAPDAGDRALDAALASAGAGFVTRLPQGLDTPLGEAGRALSGGERQRIALARALLAEPDLLILDEATSALDPETDAAIAHAIAALEGVRTVVIIGHRGALTAAARHRISLGGELASDRQGTLVNGG